MTEPNERPIASCEATKHSYRQTSRGVVISFLVHPDNVQQEFASMPLGDVVKLYVTKPDIGV